MPPVYFVSLGPQLFIFTSSFLFSHLGHLLIFLALVNPLLFFIPLLFLFSSDPPASSWFPKGDVFSIRHGSKHVEIFHSYSAF